MPFYEEPNGGTERQYLSKGMGGERKREGEESRGLSLRSIEWPPASHITHARKQTDKYMHYPHP